MEGRVCLHRKILEWERWEDHNVFRLFCFIILSCNHKDNKRKWQLIEKGSFITSYEKLSVWTGLSYQKIRTCLQKLESTSEITRKVTSKNQTITVCNWEVYQQEEKKVTNKSTGKQQTNNKQITTNNNDNNDNNDNKKKKTLFSPPTLQDVEQYFTTNQYSVASARKAWNYYEVADWHDSSGKKVKNWKQKMQSVWFKEENKAKAWMSKLSDEEIAERTKR